MEEIESEEEEARLRTYRTNTRSRSYFCSFFRCIPSRFVDALSSVLEVQQTVYRFDRTRRLLTLRDTNGGTR